MTLKHIWEHREQYSFSLNSLYVALGYTKQSFHQRLNRWLELEDLQEQVLRIVHAVRNNHPTMGVRDIYYKMRPKGIGRDRFEAICHEAGLSSIRPTCVIKTTNSNGVKRFDNLLNGLIINRINQVWQSDITYFEIGGFFYYITFIQDSYSKLIVGHSVSKSLKTVETTLPALRKAIRSRKVDLSGLIFHSDGGGQYYCGEFLAITQEHKIQNSMGKEAWENGMAERLNGVIKNNYLKHWQIGTFDELKKEVDRAVLLYNKEKPHIGLQRKAPEMFERELLLLR